MEKICKECNVMKSLSEYYSHPKGNLGTLGRCKECIKSGRKTERERSMARILDNKRSLNKDRLIHLGNQSKKYRSLYPEKYKAHQKVNNYLRYHDSERQSLCSYCNTKPNQKKGIVMHHENYLFPNKVIPLCKLCHAKYHKGLIKIDLTKEITLNF